MARVLVTGGAGFIGNAVVRHLLDRGDRVTVVDAMPGPRQHRALAATSSRVDLVVDDLRGLDLDALLARHDLVVHLAGRPGVQTSWAEGFRDHLDHNVEATHRLLESALRTRVRRLVLASSSSVYGDVPTGAAHEDLPTRPLSPYGASKAAMELLAGVYASRGVPLTVLRYFTVVGPRQRPDMALHRMIDATRTGRPFPLRGDGSQVRDFTGVDDVARATVAAAVADLPSGTVLNIGGGAPVSVRELLKMVRAETGCAVPVTRVPAVPGDPARTASDCRRAAQLLGWRPRQTLAEVVRDQVIHATGDVVADAA